MGGGRRIGWLHSPSQGLVFRHPRVTVGAGSGGNGGSTRRRVIVAVRSWKGSGAGWAKMTKHFGAKTGITGVEFSTVDISNFLKKNRSAPLCLLAGVTMGAEKKSQFFWGGFQTSKVFSKLRPSKGWNIFLVA